jgi:hypothetical protein
MIKATEHLKMPGNASNWSQNIMIYFRLVVLCSINLSGE